MNDFLKWLSRGKWAAFTCVALCSCPTFGAGGASGAVPGIIHQHHQSRKIPWSIHVLRIDRTRPEFELTTALADGTKIGLSTLTEQLRRIPGSAGKPLAAINGDFYRTEEARHPGDPRGLQIARGELVSGPGERACFWITPAGEPRLGQVTAQFTVTWPDEGQTVFGLNEARSRQAVLYTSAIGPSTGTAGGVEYVLEAVDARRWLPLRPGATMPARIRQIRRRGNTRTSDDTLILSLSRELNAASIGEVVIVSMETQPSLAGVKTAIGGGPALVRGGKAQSTRVNKGGERHPRSAIGWSEKEFMFVQVDGRQSHSDGMKLSELAAFLVKLGCVEAINLDGGASAEIWLNGRILNSPCWGRERSTGNALVLTEKAKP